MMGRLIGHEHISLESAGQRGDTGLKRITVALEDRGDLPGREPHQLLEVEDERPFDHGVDP
ncbi:MAG: hypothetical protein ACRD21_02665 [Vicinamibacteria bacterium]